MLQQLFQDTRRFQDPTRSSLITLERLEVALEKADLEQECPHLFLPVLMNSLAIQGAWRGAQSPREQAVQCVKDKIRREAEYFVRVAHLLSDEAPDTRLWCRNWQSVPLAQLKELGRGLIVCSPRFGLIRHLALEIFLSGHSAVMCVNSANASEWEQMFARLRSRLAKERESDERTLDVINVESANAGRRLSRALRANRIVCILADGSTGSRGPWAEGPREEVSFLGQRIAVRTGIARLSAATGAPILPLTAVREGTGRGSLHFGEAIIPPAQRSVARNGRWPRDTLQQMFSFFEATIRSTPSQWEGIAGFHRLAATGEPAPLEVVEQGRPVTANDYLSASDGKYLFTKSSDGLYAIDCSRMRCYRIPMPFGAALSRLVASSSPVKLGSLVLDNPGFDQTALISAVSQWLRWGLVSRIQ